MARGRDDHPEPAFRTQGEPVQLGVAECAVVMALTIRHGREHSAVFLGVTGLKLEGRH